MTTAPPKTSYDPGGSSADERPGLQGLKSTPTRLGWQVVVATATTSAIGFRPNERCWNTPSPPHFRELKRRDGHDHRGAARREESARRLMNGVCFPARVITETRVMSGLAPVP